MPWFQMMFLASSFGWVYDKIVMNHFWNSWVPEFQFWNSWALIVSVEPAVFVSPGEGGEPTVLAGPYLCLPQGYLQSIWHSYWPQLFLKRLVTLQFFASELLLPFSMNMHTCSTVWKESSVVKSLACDAFFLHLPFYSIQHYNTIY